MKREQVCGLSNTQLFFNLDFMDITTINDDFVQQMPVFGSKVHPSYFQHIWKFRRCARYA